MSNSVAQEERLVCVTAGPVRLDGNLTLPEGSRAVCYLPTEAAESAQFAKSTCGTLAQ
jgi:hypothetical protein